VFAPREELGMRKPPQAKENGRRLPNEGHPFLVPMDGSRFSEHAWQVAGLPSNRQTTSESSAGRQSFVAISLGAQRPNSDEVYHT